MLNSPHRRRPRAARATLLVTTAGCLAASLCACGGDDPSDRPTVTVTASSTAVAASSPTTSEPTLPEGDVDGRAHDVGTITEVIEVDGAVFLELDRYTYEDWDDERVASEGVPLTPLTDDPFTNQNAHNTYTVPVSKDVVVALNECQADGLPEPKIATQPGSIADLTVSDTVWLLTYTDGALTLADTVAPC